jgi:hypothetical protein
MSISSLFAPNNYTIYAREFIESNPDGAAIPTMTVVDTPNVIITQGVLAAGTVRGAPMVITAGKGSFGAATVDTTVVTSGPGTIVTVRVPQFTLTTISSGASGTIQLGTALAPAIPLKYVQDMPDVFAVSCILQVSAGPAVYQPCSCGVTQTGIINLIYLGATFANGSGLTADFQFTYSY